MKGTIRLLVGFIMLFGGVGGIETSTELMPLDSLGIAVGGLLLMFWAVLDINRYESDI
jgi:hypothetical protein